MVTNNRNVSVTVIPARRRVGDTETGGERPKLRVAAYCRVSADSDEQATSYEAQWRATTLQKILRNEKYIGDALLQKTYTVDFLYQETCQK